MHISIERVHRNSEGNLVAIIIETDHYSITLVVIYGPNTDTPAFFKEVQDVIEDFNTPHCIVVGDWNVALDPSQDTCNYLHTNNPRARQAVLTLMNDLNFFDAWRVFNPNEKRYTWRQKNPLKQSRLDYFLVSSGILNTITNVSISHGYRTDHSMINASFKVSQIETGKGYWKFNNSLLRDECYQNIVKSVIAEVITEYACFPYNRNVLLHLPRDKIQFTISDQLFFETLLMKVRGKTISYSSFKKRMRGK